MNSKTEKTFRAAIFDLDGTLAYTVGDLLASMNRMLEQYGYPQKTHDEIMSYISCGERDFVKFSLPENLQDNDEQIETCRETYVSIYNQHFLDTTVLYPGLDKLLHDMKSAGIRLAVNTNKTQEHAQAIINKLAPGVFEMLKGDGHYPCKPDPTGALEIAGEFGLAPAEICYIGDSNIDMETAGNAGMFAMGVKWGYRPDVLEAAGARTLVETAEEIAPWFGL
ncbi:MAG: HAD family hydrolase [Clostridia bacterium]|nr:HAD family hydrolase [Clostridia bacterium]